MLVQPYRLQDEPRVNLYVALLATFPNLDWIAPTTAIACVAANLRARYSMRTPDAIFAATAIDSGATGFVTNDTIFTRVDQFDTLVLDSLRA